VTAPAAERAGAAAPAATISQYADARYPAPLPATFLRETSLEDAIGYRLWRLAQPCPDCGTHPAANRCGDHLGDLDLLATYHRALKAAERESRLSQAERRDTERRAGAG
jgi:hypothetical protein